MLSACPSTEHRAVLGLTALSLGGPPPDGLQADLATSDPQRLAEIANLQHVHTLLACARDRAPDVCAALPDDLWLYFEEMARANCARAERGRAQLSEIGTRLASAGIEAVLLKGGADLLDPPADLTRHRFVSDFDLLVPAERARDAQSLLAEIGAKWQEHDPETAARMHHLPAMWKEDWDFTVELHTRVGQPIVRTLLSAEETWRDATETHIPGIRVQSRPHRMMHHLLHSSAHQDTRAELYLRDALDQIALIEGIGPEDRQGVALRLQTAGQNHLLRRNRALLALLLPNRMSCDEGDGCDEIWLRHALQSFGAPAARQRRVVVRLLMGMVGRFLTDPTYRSRYIRKGLTLSGWRGFQKGMEDIRGRIR